MDKLDVLQKLKREKLISVIRMDTEHSKEAIEDIIKGGVNFIEITLTMQNAYDLIAHFTRTCAMEDVVIGAGTVLDQTAARLAIMKGAKFIVAPCFNSDVAQLCNLYRIPYIPGVQTPQDIACALQAGCDLLKIFPASVARPFLINEYKGPFPQAEFIISGKVNRENATDWLNHGAYAVCLGSVLTAQIENGRDTLINTAKAFVNIAHES